MKFHAFSLAEIAEGEEKGLVDGPFGSALPAELYTHEGVPLVRGKNLSLGQHRFKDFDYVFISETAASKLKRSNCKPNDIIFTKKGTLGQTGLIPKNSKYKYFILSSNQMRFRVNKKIACPEYVYYYVSSPFCRDKIISDAMTTGVPKINLSYLRKFKIQAPSLSNQKKIAAVLSAYDDLIENNTRRIALLERMAEELYKEWFVRMRFPGHEQTRFVKGIPEGWVVKKLGEILELAYGKALKQEDRVDGAFPVFGSSGEVGTHNKFLVEGPGIIVGRKGNVGSVFWSDKSFFPIDTAYYVKSHYNLRFLIFLLKRIPFINSDAAVPGLNRSQAYSNQVLFPPVPLIERFVEVSEPLLRQGEHLSKSNQILRQTRDRLLTRLISGKLSVEDRDIAFPPSMLEDEMVQQAVAQMPAKSDVIIGAGK